MPAATALEATTADGALLVLAIVLPVVGILLSFVLGGRYAERIAAFLLPASLCVACIVFVKVWQSETSLSYVVGNWKPPLGITLRADGLSVAMMVALSLIHI